MAQKKREGFFGSIFNYVLLATNVFGLVDKLTALISVEIRAACNNVASMFILSLLCVMLFLTSWFCILGLIAFYLLALMWSIPAVLGSILLFNLLLLFLIGYFISKKKNKLLFPLSRSLITSLFK